MKSLNKYFYNKKIMPLDNFFNNVLYDKKFGYYTNKDPIGKKGDFITSPVVSFLFSEMIAIWIISYWENLKKPNNFNIVELGPGNGELFKILESTFKKFPEFYNSSNLYLYEKSKTLKTIQKKKLQSKKISWISNFDKLKKGPVIFFGNEFFDAIPIKQFEKKNGIVYEKFVKLKNNTITTVLKKASKKELEELKRLKLFKNFHFIEFPKLGLNELQKIIKKIKKLNGGLLLIDYGYLKQKNINTLQSVKRHKKNNLFSNIGSADVTSLVNFDLLRNYLISNKLKVNNIVTQSFFLKKIGILNRAEIVSNKMKFKDKSDLYFRLKRLLHPKYMGDIFKVIFAHKNNLVKVLGFN
jgi:NADH dehydrogenase [ubiquinone] 1 alpha subcomplex assembly factor 7